MVQTINLYNFRRSFELMDRTSNFSYKGLEDLFNYFEQLEEETNDQIELDVIAICCEYSEFQNLEDFKNNYGEDYDSIEDIENKTIVIGWVDEDSPFIIQDF